MERAAITGATGLIGSALANRLMSLGVEVLALANPRPRRIATPLETSNPLLTIIPCSGAEYTTLAANAQEMLRVDVFFHLAWDGTIGPSRNDPSHQERNVHMALDALALAKAFGARRFVFAGSQAEYGELHGKFSASTPCNPVTPYGKAKLRAETQTRARCNELGIEHVAARIGSAYGPGDSERTVLMQAIRHAWSGEPFACTPGEQQWDHIYSEDAAEALRLIAENGRPGAIYPIGTGKTESLKNHIIAACNACDPAFAPDIGALEYPEHQVMYLCADIDELISDTGFKSLIPFEEGIRRTARWYCGILTNLEKSQRQFDGEGNVF